MPLFIEKHEVKTTNSCILFGERGQSKNAPSEERRVLFWERADASLFLWKSGTHAISKTKINIQNLIETKRKKDL